MRVPTGVWTWTTDGSPGGRYSVDADHNVYPSGPGDKSRSSSPWLDGDQTGIANQFQETLKMKLKAFPILRATVRAPLLIAVDRACHSASFSIPGR